MKDQIMKRMEAPMKAMKEVMLNSPWHDEEFYKAWIAQTYYYARHTTRLLALGGASFSFDQPAFHKRFLEHADEEKGHEKLLINDMKAFGKKIEEYPEGHAAAGLYQTQYYYIEHVSAASFFGYVLALEYLAATYIPTINTKVEELHGRKAASFLRVHGEEDEGHVEKAVENISNLDPKDLESIFFNFHQTLNGYKNMMLECQEAAARKKSRKAA